MSVATLTLMALTLTGQVVELRSDKPFVTAQDSARIEVAVVDGSGRPVRDASLSLTVNIGALTAPVSEREGVFHATYQPPSQEGAQVALIHAAVKRGSARASGWLALPVHGPHLLRVPAPPRAQVRVSIEGASYGPVTAEARGGATVPVNVPPGVSSAQVTTVDRAGRSRTQTVPLPAPGFARIRLVVPEASSGSGPPLRIQGFVVDESGRPAVPLPPVSVSVDRGTLGPIEAREGGIFEVPYTPSEQAGPPVSLSASTLENPESPFTLQFEPPPSAEAPLSESASGSTRASGPLAGGTRWQPSVGVLLFAQSNTAFSNGLGLQVEGALQLAGLPIEALVQLEGRQNLKETQPHASGGPTTVDKEFSLRGLGLRAGARWFQPLWTRGLLFADASVGVLHMTGNVQLVGQGDTPEQPLRSTGLATSVGGGFGWAVGQGRLSGQVHWAYAPARGKVSGNLGGLSLGVGYQLPLGGGARP